MTRFAPHASPTQVSIDRLLANAARAANDVAAAIGALSAHQRIDRSAAPAALATRHAALNARALCAELVRWEGCCQHMYVDSRGFVTTGIGHLLRNAEAALALPWRHRGTGQPATAAEIRAAFDRVRAQGPGHKVLSYRLASDLVLAPGVAGDLAIRRIEREVLPGLHGLCPNFDRYPAPAQRALVEMAYNLGIAELSKFRKLRIACERGDFATAAIYCHRRTTRETRNAATRDLFVDAANLSA